MTSKIPRSGQGKLDGVFKPHNENAPRKIPTTKKQKGPPSRYGQQSDIRDQNQLLVVVNEELQRNLTETKQRMAQLEQQCSDLKGENGNFQKELKDCHVLLVAGNIDPVLGERIGQTTQQNEDERKEVVNVSKDLLGELNTFCDMTTEQSERVDEIQNTMKDLKEARELLSQERESLSLEVEEMEKALEEADMLLVK
ncbi:small kinetochore-associated protein isoform X1 [Osmerus eperlanus]|uniref:small kinetochore-associated protein isoform X1 n=1 Tax=Osmerus eperlanus TaxID=29151 RepID=UPI002E0EE945